MELQPPCYAYNVMPVVYIHVVWCCTVLLRPWVLEFACVAVCSLLVRHGSHACWSHAEAFLLDFLVSLSRSVGVMRSISVAVLHLVSFSSHHIHLHVRSACSHAASLFPYFSGCVCASRGGLENACDWASV